MRCAVLALLSGMSKLAAEPLLPVQQQPGSSGTIATTQAEPPEQQLVEASGKQARGIQAFLSGSANGLDDDGVDRKRQKAAASPMQLQVKIKGQAQTLAGQDIIFGG